MLLLTGKGSLVPIVYILKMQLCGEATVVYRDDFKLPGNDAIEEIRVGMMVRRARAETV